ncbi:MAG: LamG-like jellyroll fold domain-containing protein [Bacteroidota bacterium]
MIILAPIDSRYTRGSGTLINTTFNSFDPNSGKPVFYILTANHLVSHLPNEASVYLSFDYEVPYADGRSDERDNNRPFENIPIEKVVVDPVADIALLRVASGYFEKINKNYGDLVNGPFFHAYAAGWTLNPMNPGINISHPRSDVKKLFSNPEKIELKSGALSGGFEGKYWVSKGKWNGIVTGTQPGSSGSGLFDENLSIAAVDIRGNPTSTTFTSITNSWYYKLRDDHSTGIVGNSGLMDYLDPGKTWINEVPGGYVYDLMAVGSDKDLALSLNAGHTETREIDLPLQYLFNSMIRKSSNPVNDLFGIKILSNPGAADIFLSVEDRNNHELLYGVYINSTVPPDTKAGFENNSWRPGSWPAGTFIDRTYLGGSNAALASNEFKKRLVNSTVCQMNILHLGFNNPGARITGPIVNATVKIFRQNDAIAAPARVQAVGIPSINPVPVNAVEFFKKEQLRDTWTSKKYRSSRGSSGEKLFINSLAIKQEQDGIDKMILTGNNGGYLNLINNFYLIGPIKTSYNVTGDIEINKIKVTLDVKNRLPSGYFYKIWMDFFPETDGSNYYNFVTDEVLHTMELLGGGSGETFIEDVVMPDNEALKMKPGDTKICRMRIAVSSTDNVAQDGQYVNGEVEDYLVRIRVPTAGEVAAGRAIIRIPVGAGIQQGQGNNQCGVPGQDPDAAPAGSPVNVGDATVPYACNTYVCNTDACAGNAANNTTPLIGNYSLCISGASDYVSLDDGHEFIYKAFNNRTVSFWLNNTDDPGIEEVYDEGGSTEGGMGIRINNNTGKLELGVRNGTAFKIISAPVAATTWLHVVASFENGKLSLYQNGTLAASDNAVGFTTVPLHSDGAAFGGTNGTNVFGSVNRSYHGCADEILIFDKALTLEQVDVLYQAGGPGSTANLQAKQAETQTGGHLVTDRKSQPAASLIIYPNPSKGDVSLITEVKQAGPVIIQITDLMGRVVYEKKLSKVGAGFQQVVLRNLQLKAATYFVKVINRVDVQIRKLVVEN